MVGHTPESRKIQRRLKKLNADEYHHPDEKIAQLERLSFIDSTSRVLEVFAGAGNLTRWYEERCKSVTPMSRETTGDSFHAIYELRFKRKRFDVIDIDSYGYPSKFFPVVFEMMRPEALLIITFPVVGAACLNGITEQHFINFYRSSRPTIGDVTGILTDMALREWILLSLHDVRKIKKIYRMVFKCRREKATELCNVKNQ